METVNQHDSNEVPIEELSAQERRVLSARGHNLNPVVSISHNGLSPSVLNEIDRCLTRHELIKIRVYNDDREQRALYLRQICMRLNASPVKSIGKLLLVFRRNPEIEEQDVPPQKRPSRPRRRSATGGDRPGGRRR